MPLLEMGHIDNIQYIDAMLYMVAFLKNKLAALMMFLAMIGAVASNYYGSIGPHLGCMLLAMIVLMVYQSEVNRIIASLFIMRVVCMLSIFNLWYYFVVDTILIVLQILMILIGEDDDSGRRRNTFNYYTGNSGAIVFKPVRGLVLYWEAVKNSIQQAQEKRIK